jgi:hypothetical protein|tara:strand:- start:73 stop:276 length:204 start_codon:yes stop_codon:yes gene_type:complete
MQRVANYGHTTAKAEWFNNHENLELLACYLVETYGYTTTTLLVVLEKPWHWEYEFKKAQGEKNEILK